jgi:hypothetical protein
LSVSHFSFCRARLNYGAPPQVDAIARAASKSFSIDCSEVFAASSFDDAAAAAPSSALSGQCDNRHAHAGFIHCALAAPA